MHLSLFAWGQQPDREGIKKELGCRMNRWRETPKYVAASGT